MHKSNSDTNFLFIPKKRVKWDFALTIIIGLPIIAIGFLIIIFDTYPNITILSKIFIIVTFIILTFSFLLIFFFGSSMFNEISVNNESIKRKKLWIETTIYWEEITNIFEERQFGIQRTEGDRLFTIRSRKKWFTFSDKIMDYEKLKEIVLDKSGSKNFKHDENRFGETWEK